MGEAAPPPETPLILVGSEGSRRIVQATNQAALKAGLHTGMPASKAQALIQNLIVLKAQPDTDHAALDQLARWALRRYAPIVTTDPPDGLVVDATGATHLHGGESAMLCDMVRRLAESGIAARAALADTWGAAHAFARFQTDPILVLPPGQSAEALLPLPVAALRLPSEIVHGLHRLGLKSVGDLEHMPRAPLALRFGSQPGRRLDQAMNRACEPIHPIRLPEIAETRRAFTEPIAAAETIAHYIEKLVVDLCRMLETRGQGVRRLDLLCHRVDAQIASVRIGTAMPVREPKRLTRLLREKIELIDPGFGIELMCLSATCTESLEARQILSNLVAPPEAGIADLIDTLSNRIGAKRIYRMASVESDVPERSLTRVSPMSAETSRSWCISWPRPVHLLQPPEPIETMALLPDHPPVSFLWRGLRRKVRAADGPERIFGEWWTHDAEMQAVRDYFRVEDEAGERFWIYRAGDGEHAETGSQNWFLHGIFG